MIRFGPSTFKTFRVEQFRKSEKKKSNFHKGNFWTFVANKLTFFTQFCKNRCTFVPSFSFLSQIVYWKKNCLITRICKERREYWKNFTFSSNYIILKFCLILMKFQTFFFLDILQNNFYLNWMFIQILIG